MECHPEPYLVVSFLDGGDGANMLMMLLDGMIVVIVSAACVALEVVSVRPGAEVGWVLTCGDGVWGIGRDYVCTLLLCIVCKRSS